MLWGLVFVWVLVCGLMVIVGWCLLDLFGWLRLDGDLVCLWVLVDAVGRCV